MILNKIKNWILNFVSYFKKSFPTPPALPAASIDKEVGPYRSTQNVDSSQVDEINYQLDKINLSKPAVDNNSGC